MPSFFIKGKAPKKRGHRGGTLLGAGFLSGEDHVIARGREICFVAEVPGIFKGNKKTGGKS